MSNNLSELTIIIKGAGEMASGVACRLFDSHFRKIIMLDVAKPLAVRRGVAFCEAVYEKEKTVEGITACLIDHVDRVGDAWQRNEIPVLVDPDWRSVKRLQPDILVDAILAKKNLGTTPGDAKLVIALGPGFMAGRDAHVLVETNRGHNLGRLIVEGETEPNTGIPGAINNVTRQRVLRAPADGVFRNVKNIGDSVKSGDIVGHVGDSRVTAEINGVLRGLIRSETEVFKSLKIGDIDPRNDAGYCFTVSEKARAIGGSILEAILHRYNC